MVASKTDLFNQELQERANLFKALAHPARLQIIKYLAETRICLSGDISDMFPISRNGKPTYARTEKCRTNFFARKRRENLLLSGIRDCLNLEYLQIKH